MFQAYPKIFAIGTDYIKDIFNEEVEVTEKIDGSQFSFGKINGEILMRSKGTQLFPDNPEKMFKEAIDYVSTLNLPEGIIFYAEYLKKPTHNTLKYNRVPQNHLILFGMMDMTHKFYEDLSKYSTLFEIERVPILFQGKINSIQELASLLNTESILGGTKIEGIVIKNYSRQFLLGGQPIPIMAGKFVSEVFKEVHRERWGREETGKSKLETFFESFRTPARWEKSIQHLQEKGELENSPRDIGKLFKEVQTDIEIEEKESVKNFLWNEFKGDIKRKATAGMAEWYKGRLAERSFTE